MKKTQWKDAFRDIRKTFVSWIAIVTVTMIGCGVCFGVTFYADSLAEKGNRFFDETCYEDFMVLAPRGLSAEEIGRLKTAEGVEEAEGAYMLTGAKIHVGESTEDTALCTLTSLVSQPCLTEGRLPAAENECALPTAFMQRRGIRIGDPVRITLHSAEIPNGFVKNEIFTVTAAIEHGDCICTEYNSYVYVPLSALNTGLLMNRFTCIRIAAALPEGETHLSDSYPESMLPVRLALEEKLEEIGREQSPVFRAAFGVLSRDAKEGFITFRTDIRIVHTLALIFVALFLLIGTVVTASTLTILIDNRKKQLGTMRAYGFTLPEIMLRFLVYGVSAVLAGLLLSVILAAGLQSFIRSVIGDLFIVKPEGFAFYPPLFCVLSAAELLLCCIVAPFVTRLRVSRFSAVELMSGAAPDRRMPAETDGDPSGSLYSRLILRNMRMDKPRILTSVAIIAGSCLLIGIGITLKDSLDDTMPRSAREIRHYDLEILLPDGAEEEECREVADWLAQQKAETVWIHQITAVYQVGDTREYATVLSGPDSLYPDYLELRDPSGALITPQNGLTVIADCRISERLSLHAGDTVTLYDSLFHPFGASVTGICRNYFPRLICMGEEAFSQVFGESVPCRTALIRCEGDLEKTEAALRERFPSCTITRTDTLPDAFEPMSRMFHAVVYILIVLSLFMGVFVLLNLVNIFVGRRKNELIIMAVHGFDKGQQVRYLLKETLITTVCGLLLGFLLGWMMTGPVVRTVEVGEMMFVRSLNLKAWLIATGVEALFALIINLFAFRRIRGFDLTELTR